MILNKIKKAFLPLLALTVLIQPLSTRAEGMVFPKPSEPAAESAILYDMDTKTVLYEKNADLQEHPASITKILTALVAVEHSKLNEKVVFSKEAVYKNETSTGSHIARGVGEEMTMEQCLYALLLASANECADAIAEHISGTSEKFVELMNDKARSLGCTNTHFSCTNGFDDDNHYTSARDMALIATAAYANPVVKKMMGTKTYTIKPTNVHTDPTYLKNHHDMLTPYRTGKYLYKYCTGGKTGYTILAGNTLVTYAEKNGMRLVCVVLKESAQYQKYVDTRNLFDFAFDNFKHVNSREIVKKDQSLAKVFKDQKFDELSVEAKDITCPVNADMTKFTYDASEEKRKKGSAEVGKAKIYYNGSEIAEVSVKNETALKKEQAALKKKSSEKNSGKKKNYLPLILVIVISTGLVIGLYFWSRFVPHKKFRQRKDGYREYATGNRRKNVRKRNKRQ